jgi:hypothetical protein
MSNKDQILLENAYLQVLENAKECECECKPCKEGNCEECSCEECDCEGCKCNKEKTVTEEGSKVNPWAVEKSIEKKTGKTFGKKHKEEIVKGIKKTAKKSGKKITSDSIKKKVVKESYSDDETEIVYLGDKEYLVCFSSELDNAVEYVFDYSDYGMIYGNEDQIALYSYIRDRGNGRRPETIKNPKLINFVKRIQKEIDKLGK